jgi:hypothetical protein
MDWINYSLTEKNERSECQNKDNKKSNKKKYKRKEKKMISKQGALPPFPPLFGLKNVGFKNE